MTSRMSATRVTCFRLRFLSFPLIPPYHTITPVFQVVVGYKTGSELGSCVKVQAAVLGSLPLICFMISADVKQQ